MYFIFKRMGFWGGRARGVGIEPATSRSWGVSADRYTTRAKSQISPGSYCWQLRAAPGRQYLSIIAPCGKRPISFTLAICNGPLVGWLPKLTYLPILQLCPFLFSGLALQTSWLIF